MSEASNDAASKRERGKVRRAYGWYQWYSRFNWLRRAWIFFWDFKTGADVVAAVAALGVVGTAAGMATYDAVDYRQRVAAEIAAKKRHITTKRWSDNSSVYSVVGRDAAGRKAWFDMLVWDKDFTWVRGSWEELEHKGQQLPEAAVQAKVFTRDVRNGLAQSAEFIAVGIASSEGDPIAERERAARRAATSARWLAAAMGDGVPITLLNLGQHRRRCDGCDTTNTNWQRPFMVIGVRKKQSGVVMHEALLDAFTGKSNLPAPESYSAFTLSPLTAK